MSVLLIDFEATGLDTAKERIIEIGAMFVGDDFKTPPALMFSQLVWDPHYPEITEKVTQVTGITQSMLIKDAIAPDLAFADLNKHIVEYKPSYVVAYNRAYDETLYHAEFTRLALALPGLELMARIPWICAMNDVEAHDDKSCRKLSHISLDYGVPVNPRELHRAINDVELMRQMLIAANATAQDMYAYQQVPWLYVQAVIPKPWKDGGKGREQAKALNYSWQRCRGSDKEFAMQWVKRIRPEDLQKEKMAVPFIVMAAKESTP